MLLYGLLLFGCYLFPTRTLAPLPALAVGVWIAVQEWRLRRPSRSTSLACLTVEELVVWWWLMVFAGPALWNGAALWVTLLIGGLFVVALLVGRISWPERALPVRGLWLRRLLAGSALLALVTWPAWLACFTSAARAGLFLWPVLPCILVAVWYIVRTADILARHSVRGTDHHFGPTAGAPGAFKQ